MHLATLAWSQRGAAAGSQIVNDVAREFAEVETATDHEYAGTDFYFLRFGDYHKPNEEEAAWPSDYDYQVTQGDLSARSPHPGFGTDFLRCGSKDSTARLPHPGFAKDDVQAQQALINRCDTALNR
eukprot:536995-Prymnesium_polylepis.1